MIPTTDLREGRYIRLKQGLMEQVTVFSDSPTETVPHQLKRGARRLHSVDLSDAFVGIPKNFPVIKSVLAEVINDIPMQSGGDIRDLVTIEKYLDLGLADVTIGTAAAKNPSFMRRVCKEFPGQITVGLDAENDVVVIDGWATVTKHHVADLAKRFEEDDVNAIIYIDIGRNGMIDGINIEATIKLAQAAAVPVVALGGLTSLDDIHVLCAVEKHGVVGATTGHAIYEGDIGSAEA